MTSEFNDMAAILKQLSSAAKDRADTVAPRTEEMTATINEIAQSVQKTPSISALSGR